MSKRHGILTPYTSFLADENVRLSDLAERQRAASSALDALQRVGGRSGFSQRRLKARYQRANSTPLGGLAITTDVDSGEESTVTTVLYVGAKTFLRRGGRWVESTLTSQQVANPRRIDRYSKAYFDLIEKHGQHITKYLTMEGDVMLQFDGEVYAF